MKVKSVLIKHHSKKVYGTMELQFHKFLITALDGTEWIASCHGCFTARERAPGMYCIGGWVGLSGGLNAVEKISCPCLESNPDSSV
jgi:hypothetical protein